MSVRVETTDRAITAFGGAELLRETARAVGLRGALDDCLRLKKRARGLSDTEFAMGMAESIALGASCLDDLAVNRADAAQAALRGFEVPPPRRIHDHHRAVLVAATAQISLALDMRCGARRSAGGRRSVVRLPRLSLPAFSGRMVTTSHINSTLDPVRRAGRQLGAAGGTADVLEAFQQASAARSRSRAGRSRRNDASTRTRGRRPSLSRARHHRSAAAHCRARRRRRGPRTA